MTAIGSEPQLLHHSTRLTAADVPLPTLFESLEHARDADRIAGFYLDAAALQSELELRKRQEDSKHLQILADRHTVEKEALEGSQQEERKQLATRWEATMNDLGASARQQEAQMGDRHIRELESFHAAAAQGVPKPKWSSDLLNSRRIEEHLIRQHEFKKADKLKVTADWSEAAEIRMKEEDYWAKVANEEDNLAARHARELDALRMRLTQAHDEAVIAQRRDVEKLSKRHQVERIEQAKAHGQERTDMNTALKGWFNPRKVGLGPSPLVPASPMCISLMTPTAKLTTHRSDTSPERRTKGLSCGKWTGSCADGAELGNASSSEMNQKHTALPRIPQALMPKAATPGVTPIFISAPALCRHNPPSPCHSSRSLGQSQCL